MSAGGEAVVVESVPLRPETCCHDEPRPCPFCGGAFYVSYYPTLTVIGCQSCNFHIHGHGAMSAAQTRDGICYLDIFNRWNKRATPPATIPVEALEGLAAEWHGCRDGSACGLSWAEVNDMFADELTQLIKERSNG